jgi:hypothetical protein
MWSCGGIWRVNIFFSILQLVVFFIKPNTSKPPFLSFKIMDYSSILIQYNEIIKLTAFWNVTICKYATGCNTQRQKLLVGVNTVLCTNGVPILRKPIPLSVNFHL